MSEHLIQIEQHGGVRVLRLNRPEALNAFTAVMLGQLRHALEAAADDGPTRCVLITGAGRAFSAGQDLADPHVAPSSDPAAAPKDIGHMLDHYYIPLALRLRSMPVPVVAAVNGVAAGAGANMALSCDIVLAAETASFIQAFSRIGLLPDCGGTWLLPRLVGRAKALELALLGDKLKAADAAALGLISRVVPDAELADAAMAVAQKLAGMPTRALVETRRAMDEALRLDFEPALKQEAVLQSQLGFAHDYLEGAAAFLDKRKPEFKDR
ncbi:2-(1,2-epoxy-1,2-dihydrophenyl)acetyl-CoA isomerase [Pelomonas aquatica]|uniref:2-(1,2-epoxy-1,2-dihydrophenyl)acetyl-CoA isomerase n=1 Tax=Pelomonas aquatica TaxID=431058 RepID=A0ABU1Z5R0_9BURK|nr:enoyl-CoA hydratase-related protein [Pelomonas aquatica]MDR7295954.1 2-(1,2-epoxy-1,2-dihydrophenyl)acetyl-CoA isomerase [Pelomonas aquatica]